MTVILSVEELTQIRERAENAHVDLDREAEFRSHSYRDILALLDALEAALTERDELEARIEAFRCVWCGEPLYTHPAFCVSKDRSNVSVAVHPETETPQ